MFTSACIGSGKADYSTFSVASVPRQWGRRPGHSPRVLSPGRSGV